MVKKYKKYKQGIFKPINKNKCKTNTCIYRSSLELTYMRWLDKNNSIIEWSSEDIQIPYIKPTDGKIHRYYVDFYIKLKDIKGNNHEYIVEIKPYKQTIPPKTHGNKKRSTLLYEKMTYAVNFSKWSSAKQWAKKHNMKFIIITEKDIKEKYSN